MDWLTLFGVPFALPPQRVPLGGLGGRLVTDEADALVEMGKSPEEVKAEEVSDRHGTFDVIPLFLHYFSGDSSLNPRSFTTNQALWGT